MYEQLHCYYSRDAPQFLSINLIYDNLPRFTDSSALCEGASAGRKRKAQDRSPFSHDQLIPCGSGSGSSSSSHTLNAYSTPFLLSSTMPTHLATLSPFVSSSFSLPAAYQSSSYAPSPSLLPSSYSSPTPCPASVPADLNIQQYYHIEEEQTPYMQPPVPCAYIPFDDDQECFSLKLPDDPFLLEFSNDYFSSESKFPNCFKDSYSGEMNSSILHSTALAIKLQCIPIHFLPI